MDVEKTFKRLKQAAMLLRGTAGRKGMTIELNDAEDVVVAGDLHGHLLNFKAILEFADLANHPQRHLVLQEFVHGTSRYPNGGCKSHRLLDVIATLKCQYPERVHLMMGNHELSEWTGRSIASDGTAYNELFARGVETAFEENAEEAMRLYYDLIAAMPIAVRTRNRVLMTHSIPSPRNLESFDVGLFSKWGIPEDERGAGHSLHALVWGRDLSEENSRRWAEKVDADWLITGHIAQEKGYAIPNSRQVVVCCKTRPAACIRFDAQADLTLDSLTSGIHIFPLQWEDE